MTQEELANRLNISVSYAGQMERGESIPSVEVLQLVITELNIDPRIIFLDEMQSGSPECSELYLYIRRMTPPQKRLLLDFAKMIRSYKIS